MKVVSPALNFNHYKQKKYIKTLVVKYLSLVGSHFIIQEYRKLYKKPLILCKNGFIIKLVAKDLVVSPAPHPRLSSK